MQSGLSDRFAIALRDAGISNLAELARDIGASPSALYQIRDGKTRALAAETAISLARRTGVRVEWLVLGEGPRRDGGESAATRTPPLSANAVAAAYAIVDEAISDTATTAALAARATVFSTAYRLVASGTDPGVVADTVRELLQALQ